MIVQNVSIYDNIFEVVLSVSIGQTILQADGEGG